MSVATTVALVAAGGALGAGARYWITGLVAVRLGERFPWGTMAVNVSGALAIGVVAAVSIPAGGTVGVGWWALLVVGVLGSYTTVSSFSFQTVALVRTGQPIRALANVALSFALCLAAAGAGYTAVAAVAGG